MTAAYILPLRAVQAVFTIVVLGLSAYVVDSFWISPNSYNFLLFTCVWTILALAYLIIAPTRFPKAAHKFGILIAEALTMVFWFAGFIAVAVDLSRSVGCFGRVCSCAKAAIVFASFTWLLFAITTIMASLHVWNTRSTGETRHDPKMEVHQTV